MGLKLEDINGIGKTTADRMKSAGIDSVEKIASIKLESLLKINGIGKSTAEKYIEDAKNLLDSMKSKERKDMLEEKQTSEKNTISSETQTQTSDKKVTLESNDQKMNITRTHLIEQFRTIPPTFLDEKTRIAINKKLNGTKRTSSDNYYLRKLKSLVREKLDEASYYELLKTILDS